MNKYIIFLLAAFIFITPSCDNDDPDELKLVISCNPGSEHSNGSFSGTYWVDGGSAVSFSGTPTESSDIDIRIYEETFKNADTLIINATKAYADSSLYVYIYLNDDLVENESLIANQPSATDPTLQMEVIYQSSDSTDSTSSE